MNAYVKNISGFSAHADQGDLVGFVGGVRDGVSEVKLVHGDSLAKSELRQQLDSVMAKKN